MSRVQQIKAITDQAITDLCAVSPGASVIIIVQERGAGTAIMHNADDQKVPVLLMQMAMNHRLKTKGNRHG